MMSYTACIEYEHSDVQMDERTLYIAVMNWWQVVNIERRCLNMGEAEDKKL